VPKKSRAASRETSASFNRILPESTYRLPALAIPVVEITSEALRKDIVARYGWEELCCDRSEGVESTELSSRKRPGAHPAWGKAICYS